MAKEAIEQIRDAENQADESIKNAKKQAEEIVAKAHADGEEFLKASIASENKNKKISCEEAKKKAETLYNNEINDYNISVEHEINKAGSKKASAIDAVISQIFK